MIMLRWSHGKRTALWQTSKLESEVMFLVYVLGPKLGLVAE